MTGYGNHYKSDFRAQEIPVRFDDVMRICRDMGSIIQEAGDKDDVFLMRTFVTGTYFIKDIRIIVRDLKEGDEVRLVREPDNEYDSNAIKVLSDKGLKMGYIPKNMNRDLAKILDIGIQIRAEIESLYNDSITLNVSMLHGGPIVEWQFTYIYDFFIDDDVPEWGPASREIRFKDMSGPMKELAFSRCFSEEDLRLLRWGHRAPTMEDKWNMHFEDGVLYFSRSWTGHCIYKLILGNGSKHRLIVNMDEGVWRPQPDDDFAGTVDKMIDRYLGDRLEPAYIHPTKEGTMLIRPPMHLQGE